MYQIVQTSDPKDVQPTMTVLNDKILSFWSLGTTMWCGMEGG